MVSEMSLPTTIMICVGWRKKSVRQIRGITQRLYPEFIFGIQTSNEHPVNDHLTEKKHRSAVGPGPWEGHRGKGIWKARGRKGVRRQGEACTVTGMHSDSDAHAGKPFPSIRTYFKDLLLHTKGRGRKGEGPAGSRWE